MTTPTMKRFADELPEANRELVVFKTDGTAERMNFAATPRLADCEGLEFWCYVPPSPPEYRDGEHVERFRSGRRWRTGILGHYVNDDVAREVLRELAEALGEAPVDRGTGSKEHAICYVCGSGRDPDDRRLVTMHTKKGDVGCSICERCQNLVEWEPLEPPMVGDAERIAASINADTSTPAVAEVVDGEVKQRIPEPASMRLVSDDGLPPLADGSRWDGEWIVEGESAHERATRHCLHEYSPGDWCLRSEIEPPDVADPPTVATLRCLVARHDRKSGIADRGESDWWADEMRALAKRFRAGDVLAPMYGAAKDHAASAIEGVLERLARKGMC